MYVCMYVCVSIRVYIYIYANVNLNIRGIHTIWIIFHFSFPFFYPDYNSNITSDVPLTVIGIFGQVIRVCFTPICSPKSLRRPLLPRVIRESRVPTATPTPSVQPFTSLTMQSLHLHTTQRTGLCVTATTDTVSTVSAPHWSSTPGTTKAWVPCSLRSSCPGCRCWDRYVCMPVQ